MLFVGHISGKQGSPDVQIINNLVNAEISERDGGSANLETNYKYSDLSIFINQSAYNYKLNSAIADIVDKGTDLSEVIVDFECDSRPQGDASDIGADEFTSK